MWLLIFKKVGGFGAGAIVKSRCLKFRILTILTIKLRFFNGYFSKKSASNMIGLLQSWIIESCQSVRRDKIKSLGN